MSTIAAVNELFHFNLFLETKTMIRFLVQTALLFALLYVALLIGHAYEEWFNAKEGDMYFGKQLSYWMNNY